MREVWFVQREAKREEGSVPSKCNNCHVSNQLAKSVPWQLPVPHRLVQWKGKKNQCLYQQNAAETERTGGKYLAHKAASKCSLVCITSYAATEAYWHICKQKQTNKKLQSLFAIFKPHTTHMNCLQVTKHLGTPGTASTHCFCAEFLCAPSTNLHWFFTV